jgi:hypothetical protein
MLESMARNSTGEIPQSLKDRPSLTRWNAEYYRAFSVLSDSRQIGQGGIGPIPLSEMLAYMTIHEIGDLEERERFTTMVKALDRVYMEHVNTKLQADRDRAARTPGKRTRRK